MTREDRQLLFTDLCARLPYGVKVEVKNYRCNGEVRNVEIETLNVEHLTSPIERYRPYLRPMSSMTEEEYDEMFQQLYSAQEEFFRNCSNTDTIGKTITYDLVRYDWLNKNMFDFRGLIPKGLGISTEVFNPYAED